MICSGVCRLLPIVDLPVAATKMPDPNIRTGLVSGGHVKCLEVELHEILQQGSITPD